MARSGTGGQGLLPLPDRVDTPGRKSKLAVELPQYRWKIGGQLPSIGVHSVAKHEIYDDYVLKCILTLTKNHYQRRLKLTIVDGFCGGGRYSFRGSPIDGSPLRLLRAVAAAQAALAAQGRTDFHLDVEFFFIDDKADHIEFLRSELVSEGFGPLLEKTVFLIKSRFEEVAGQVIERIQKRGKAHRSLFFLDQFGWSAVTLSVVRSIMGQLSNPEVVLTFMVDSLANLLDQRESSLKSLAKIDFTRDDVKELLSLKKMDGWKILIQNYLYKHIQANTGAEFYTPFFVHPPESHRDYWLLHLSKHHQAREEIGKVFWNKNNTMEHFGREGFHALGFDPSQDVRQHVMSYTFDDDGRARSKRRILEQIPPMLYEEWKSGKPITKKSLFATKANDTPVVSDILDSQLAELRDAGELVMVSVKRDAKGNVVNRSVRRSSQTFEWDDEIQLPKQPTLFSIAGNYNRKP